MDEESGLLPELRGGQSVSVRKDKPYVTLTGLPISDKAADRPRLESHFPRPVTVTALGLKLIASKSSTTPAPSSRQPLSLQLTVDVLAKKPGDTDFTPLKETGGAAEKVGINAVFQEQAFPSIIISDILRTIWCAHSGPFPRPFPIRILKRQDNLIISFPGLHLPGHNTRPEGGRDSEGAAPEQGHNSSGHCAASYSVPNCHGPGFGNTEIYGFRMLRG